MAISTFLTAIKLSPGAKILSDPTSQDFKQAIERWTELGLQIPGAIVMVETEGDILKNCMSPIENASRPNSIR